MATHLNCQANRYNPPIMNRSWKALICLLISASISIVWARSIQAASDGGMADFKAVFYGARCLIQHRDPYVEAQFLHVYLAGGDKLPADPATHQLFLRAIAVCINLPTSLLLIAPLAMLASGVAQFVWIILSVASLLLAAYLSWELAGADVNTVALFMIGMVLANSETLFANGNLAGVVVGLCVAAVWCFVKGRFIHAGILCLAVSLAMKPHLVGLVWLYFVLAGGARRKYALQALMVTAVFALMALLWVSNLAPHWLLELRSNLHAGALRGGLSDPGPTSMLAGNAGLIIDLQSALSIIWDDPIFYDSATYGICGTILVIWSVRTWRSSRSRESLWLALAAVSPLTLLVTYHRPYDAKLLLLSIPACSMLWAEGGIMGWIMLLLTSAGITITSDIPLSIIYLVTSRLHLARVGFLAKVVDLILTRPAPVILLLMSTAYMWIYVRTARIPEAKANMWT